MMCFQQKDGAMFEGDHVETMPVMQYFNPADTAKMGTLATLGG